MQSALTITLAKVGESNHRSSATLVKALPMHI